MNIIDKLRQLKEEDYDMYFDITEGFRDICIWGIAIVAAYKLLLAVIQMVCSTKTCGSGELSGTTKSE